MTAVCEARSTRATKVEMEHRENVLLELAEVNKPASVRNIYYRAVVAGLVPKNENGYAKVQRSLATLRRQGRLPYPWITDNTRWMRKPISWDSIDEALSETARLYRRDLWRTAGVRIEVWCESDSIAGVVGDVTSEWDVPLFPTKGFAPLTFTWQAAQNANEAEVPLVIYYVGDHDPAGLEIEKKLRATLTEHLTVPMEFTRVGVTWDHVEEHDLPGTKPKKSYGFPLAVEAEALPPNILRTLLANAIVQHVNRRHLEVVCAAEDSERLILANLARGMAS